MSGFLIETSICLTNNAHFYYVNSWKYVYNRGTLLPKLAVPKAVVGDVLDLRQLELHNDVIHTAHDKYAVLVALYRTGTPATAHSLSWKGLKVLIRVDPPSIVLKGTQHNERIPAYKYTRPPIWRNGLRQLSKAFVQPVKHLHMHCSCASA